MSGDGRVKGASAASPKGNRLKDGEGERHGFL